MLETSPGRYRDLLHNRGFLLWVSSSEAANIGYAVYEITVLWLTYHLTSSFFLVGVVLFVEYGIYTLTFLFAPLVDRIANKQRILLLCYPLAAVTAASLGIAYSQGSLGVPLLLLLVGILAVFWDLLWAVAQVAPRLLVGADRLFLASGFSGAIGGANQIAGYSIGGALVLFVGPAEGAYLYAGLLALATALCVPLTLSSKPGAPSSFLQDFRAGWQYFRRRAEPSLWPLIVVSTIAGFFTASPGLLILDSSNTLFPDPALAYGILFTADVVGGVVAGLILGRLNPRTRIGGLLIGALIVAGGVMIITPYAAPSLLLSVVGWFVLGAGLTIHLTAKYNFLQGKFPPHALARIASNLFVFTGAAATAGAIVLGAVATQVSAIELGAFIGLGLLTAGLAGLASSGFRRLSY